MAKIEVRSRLIGNEIDHHITTSGILTKGKIVYREPDICMIVKFKFSWLKKINHGYEGD